MSTTSRKLALVTGASSGIGAVYAERLAQRGFDLVLVARRAGRLQALAQTIAASHGVRVQSLIADLGTEEGQASVAQFLSANPVDILVNNAGIARLAPLSGGPLDDSLAQIALNISALTRLAHAVLPGMKERNAGTIVNVASVLALKSLAFSAVYSGTKAFVLAFSQGLQEELAGTGVTVQVVLPASTATEIWDQSGVPLSALAPEAVMLTEHMVDAALVALDRGEAMTMPSVHDSELVAHFDAARSALFAASQTGKVAPRLLPA
ncbi:SDR family NAD(P)-dependent oxidoreductase [Massilia aquatica]|uniref:SDR family oxidoreductase n=1 Tax=Massilia aquatica TaxID=2609000 RepID=A0ABX0MAU9_9BURK|nr:SDR family oxidoreductase [Massilia aquatica]NHZ44157.1 SDR family oxidoreductase [Massilia aquatica]